MLLVPFVNRGKAQKGKEKIGVVGSFSSSPFPRFPGLLVDRILEVAVVPSDFPFQQHVLIARAGTNVVNYLVTLRRFGPRIYHDANMLDPTAQIPRDDVAR